MGPPNLLLPTICVALLTLTGRCDPLVAGKVPANDPSNVWQGRGAKEVPLVAYVIGALDRLVQYYEKNYELLSLDGIFGAKAIEGKCGFGCAGVVDTNRIGGGDGW